MNEILTKEQIAQNYSSAMDSVNLILSGNVHNESEQNWAEIVKRNKEHLEIMLAKDYWTTENLKPFKDAIAFV
jgi:hypothetical protein